MNPKGNWSTATSAVAALLAGCATIASSDLNATRQLTDVSTEEDSLNSENDHRMRPTLVLHFNIDGQTLDLISANLVYLPVRPRRRGAIENSIEVVARDPAGAIVGRAAASDNQINALESESAREVVTLQKRSASLAVPLTSLPQTLTVTVTDLNRESHSYDISEAIGAIKSFCSANAADAFCVRIHRDTADMPAQRTIE